MCYEYIRTQSQDVMTIFARNDNFKIHVLSHSHALKVYTKTWNYRLSWSFRSGVPITQGIRSLPKYSHKIKILSSFPIDGIAVYKQLFNYVLQQLIKKNTENLANFGGEIVDKLFWRNYVWNLWPISSYILDHQAIEIQDSIFCFGICNNIWKNFN